MRVGSLFSGIGGLDLGLERAGMDVIWQSEIDPYCCRVLAKHWPDVPNLGDVKTIDWSGVERPDLICGGYPCQPFSQAGSRRGEDDSRHLWPHMVDAIRILRPRYALLENVAGHLSLGFGRVLGDLAESGYDCEWDCIPAAAVGAPHRRDRVFVVAYTKSECGTDEPKGVDAAALFARQSRTGDRAQGGDRPTGSVVDRRASASSSSDVADTRGIGFDRRTSVEGTRRQAPIRSETGSHVGDCRRSSDVADSDRSGLTDIQGCSACPECTGSGAADRAGWWDVEPDVGRVAHGVPSRVDRLRSLGNTVVPAVAEFVGRRILERAA